MKKLTGKCFFNGFTLIELLVVITIISILMALGFTVYSFVVRQGRDSKRQSDIRSIQSALEQYYADQGFYPCTVTCLNGTSTALGFSGAISAASSDRTTFRAFTNAIGNPVVPSSLKTYMNALPYDPDPENQAAWKYDYLASPVNCNNLSNTKCTSYCLYARLENSSTRIGAPATVCDNTTYEFAVTPP